MLENPYLSLILTLGTLQGGLYLLQMWGESKANASFYSSGHMIGVFLLAVNVIFTLVRSLYVEDYVWRGKCSVHAIWVGILGIGVLFFMGIVPSVLLIGFLACLVVEFRRHELALVMLPSAIMALLGASYLLFAYDSVLQIKHLSIPAAVLLVQGGRGMKTLITELYRM